MIILEQSVNRNKVRRERVQQLNGKSGRLVCILLFGCERIHFGLVGAGMCGSRRVWKGRLWNRRGNFKSKICQLLSVIYALMTLFISLFQTHNVAPRDLLKQSPTNK